LDSLSGWTFPEGKIERQVVIRATIPQEQKRLRKVVRAVGIQ
jgi:hypothetical protein